MLIFLNDNLDEVQSLENSQKGMLRLYPNGESVDGVVDISPRLGRALMFKSEEMLHQVISSHKWDNYAITVYFNQIVNKPPVLHPIPESWKIFVGIASYRDPQLIHTIKSLIDQATHPERLRIVVYNQFDYLQKWDRKKFQDLVKYISDV